MKYSLMIVPEAEADLAEAFSWYEGKKGGLGYNFLLHVEAGLRFIERMPEINPSEYKGTRKYLIKRFPYKIIYLIDHEAVILLAVIHAKRDPEVIRQRRNKSALTLNPHSVARDLER